MEVKVLGGCALVRGSLDALHARKFRFGRWARKKGMGGDAVGDDCCGLGCEDVMGLCRYVVQGLGFRCGVAMPLRLSSQ